MNPAASAVPAAMGVAPTSRVISPQVNADNTVTLRCDAANARSVTVIIEGVAKPLPLTRNPTNGIWEVTTPPMPPNLYGYTFSIDGKRALDPQNATVRPNLLSPASVMHVPASTPQPWELQDLPHGEVTHILYRSNLVTPTTDDTGDRNLYVYTPPGYDATRQQQYPVLYLNHGYSDGANGWVEAGQANLILDALLHEGKIQPMVVVMPLGYGAMRIVKAGWSNLSGETLWNNQLAFAHQLLHEIIPMAEARFNIARDRDHRAIAGLSMGGGHSIYTGLNHPETFAYIGAFSSAIVAPGVPLAHPGAIHEASYATGFNAILPNADTQEPVKLFWLSCGTQDSLITVNQAFSAWAKANLKGNTITRKISGMHTWMVWRDDLITFTPLLFK
jgi:enterochelin esterase-like enzyme